MYFNAVELYKDMFFLYKMDKDYFQKKVIQLISSETYFKKLQAKT